MSKKVASIVALVALVLAASIPALAQQTPVSEECPTPEGSAAQASCASLVPCAVPPAEPADTCFLNGMFPVGYPVVTGPGIVQTGPDSVYLCGNGSVPTGALDPAQEFAAQGTCNSHFGTPLPPEHFRDPGLDTGFLQYLPSPEQCAHLLEEIGTDPCSQSVFQDALPST